MRDTSTKMLTGTTANQPETQPSATSSMDLLTGGKAAGSTAPEVPRAHESGLYLDLGCGRYKVPGTIGVDQSLEVNPDVVCNFVEDPLPFADDSVDGVHCRHVMEHVEDIWALMSEVHRVLKPGARLIVEVPYWSSEGAFRDPTHVRFFSEKSFDYWDPDCECKYYTTDGGYKVLSVEHMLHPSPLIRFAAKVLGVRFLKLFNNTITGLRFTLAPVESVPVEAAGKATR